MIDVRFKAVVRTCSGIPYDILIVADNISEAARKLSTAIEEAANDPIEPVRIYFVSLAPHYVSVIP